MAWNTMQPGWQNKANAFLGAPMLNMGLGLLAAGSDSRINPWQAAQQGLTSGMQQNTQAEMMGLRRQEAQRAQSQWEQQQAQQAAWNKAMGLPAPGTGVGAPATPGTQVASAGPLPAGASAGPGAPMNLIPPAMQPTPAAVTPRGPQAPQGGLLAQAGFDPAQAASMRPLLAAMGPQAGGGMLAQMMQARMAAQNKASAPMTVAAGSTVYDPATQQGVFTAPVRSRLLTSEEEAQKARLAQAGRPTTTIKNQMGGGRYGTIPPGYMLRETPEGAIMEPIPGGPVADEMAAAQAQKGTQIQADVAKAETMLDATSGIRAEFEGANTPVTGTGSALFAQFSGSPAGRVRSYVDTLQSGTVLGTMQELKKASASGATGFGALNEKELSLMISAIGALDPATTDPDIFLKTIERIENQYSRVIQDIKANVSPERIRELGLEDLIAKAGGDVPAGAGPAKVTSDEDYNALPSGTEFVGPDGTVRRKP